MYEGAVGAYLKENPSPSPELFVCLTVARSFHKCVHALYQRGDFPCKRAMCAVASHSACSA